MKRILRIIGLVLLGLLVISTFMFLWQKSRPKVVQYTIVTAQKGDIQKSTVATGKVEPRNEILIKPQMSGIISEVYKEAGDMVKAGDIIAKIQVVPDSEVEFYLMLCQLEVKKLPSSVVAQVLQHLLLLEKGSMFSVNKD
jgi:hypothetical protein